MNNYKIEYQINVIVTAEAESEAEAIEKVHKGQAKTIKSEIVSDYELIEVTKI